MKKTILIFFIVASVFCLSWTQEDIKPLSSNVDTVEADSLHYLLVMDSNYHNLIKPDKENMTDVIKLANDTFNRDRSEERIRNFCHMKCQHLLGKDKFGQGFSYGNCMHECLQFAK